MRLPQQSPPIARFEGTLLFGRVAPSTNPKNARTCACKKDPKKKKCKVRNDANHCQGRRPTCGPYPACDCTCQLG
jgi:hypothetical protein